MNSNSLYFINICDFAFSFQFYALIEGGHSPIEFTKEIYIGTVPMCRREMQSCIAGLYNQPYQRRASEGGGGTGTGTLLRDGDVFHGTRASQMSLTQLVSVGGARQSVALFPTAPAISMPSLDIDNNDNNGGVKVAGDIVTPPKEQSYLQRNAAEGSAVVAVGGDPDSADTVHILEEEDIIISGVGLSPTKQKNDKILIRSESPEQTQNTVASESETLIQKTPQQPPPQQQQSLLPSPDHYQVWERPPPFAPGHESEDTTMSTADARLIENEHIRPAAINPDALPPPRSLGLTATAPPPSTSLG